MAALAPVVANPHISTVLPYTKDEQRRQDQIDELNKVVIPGQQDAQGKAIPSTWETQVRDKIGDLKPKYVPKCKDSTWGGNLQHARDHMYLASAKRSYFAYKAKDYSLGAVKSMAALPAIFCNTIAHLFNCKGTDRKAQLARDWKDITDAFVFMVKGALLGLGSVVLALLADPLTFIYRKIAHKGDRAAVLVIDPQWSFFPAKDDVMIEGKPYQYEGGSLAVNGAWETIPVIHRLRKSIKQAMGFFVGSRDDHPLLHGSFGKVSGAANFVPGNTLDGMPQTMWPVHCVRGSRGWEYVAGLATDLFDNIIDKGRNPRVDSYSAFYDNNHKDKTLMTEYLKETLGITHLFLAGVAYDYCVGYSALDAAKEKFRGAAAFKEVTVVRDATRGVAGYADEMTAKLTAAGVKIVNAADLIGNSKFFPWVQPA